MFELGPGRPWSSGGTRRIPRAIAYERLSPQRHHAPCRFPVDVIKIDKSFVDGLAVSGPSLALAKSIVRLAHNLRLKTVAEGVEDQAQRTRLAAMGCDYAQGYLFAKPLNAEAATAFVREAAAPLPLAG